MVGWLRSARSRDLFSRAGHAREGRIERRPTSSNAPARAVGAGGGDDAQPDASSAASEAPAAKGAP